MANCCVASPTVITSSNLAFARGTIEEFVQRATRALRARAEGGLHLRSARIVCLTLGQVGSEGGFTAEEVRQAQQAGCTAVSLGQSILRAETASIAAVALCQFVWR